MRRALTISVVALVCVGAAVAGGSYLWLRTAFNSPGIGIQDSIIIVERGSGGAAIAADLETRGLIADARVFRYGNRLFGDGRPLRAGEFRIPAGASPAEIIRILQDGKQVVHRITIAEGLTSHEIMAVLSEDPVLVGDPPATPEEGTLLPETYHFNRGTTRAELVRRMQRSMTETVAELWTERDRSLPLTNPAEAVVLASIIEKETGVDAERTRVAGVFVNRLRKPMRLQSDPTVVYGITLGKGPLGRGLKRSELKAKTPYNTYQIDGLPPTPIANPGRASLRAALNPLVTDEFYFVADGTGGHVFSKTLDEHNKNVRAWRKIERQRRQ